MKKYNFNIKTDDEWLRESGAMVKEANVFIKYFQDQDALSVIWSSVEDLKEYDKRFPEGTDEYPGGAQWLLDQLQDMAMQTKDIVMELTGTSDDMKKLADKAIYLIKNFYGDAFKIMMQNLKDNEARNKA